MMQRSLPNSKKMADIFEADNGNLRQAEESVQLADGRDDAPVERAWHGSGKT